MLTPSSLVLLAALTPAGAAGFDGAAVKLAINTRALGNRILQAIHEAGSRGEFSPAEVALATGSLRELLLIQSNGDNILSQRVVVPGIDTYKFAKLGPEDDVDSAAQRLVESIREDIPRLMASRATPGSAPMIPPEKPGPLASAKPDPWNLNALSAAAYAVTPEGLASVKKAALAGDALEQFKLGLIFEEGFAGVKRDGVEALHWFKQAAQQGKPLAQRWVGDIYHSGMSVVKDPKVAAEWYRKAAEGGDGEAQFVLSRLVPMGAERDEWLNKSAVNGNMSARFAAATKYSRSGHERVRTGDGLSGGGGGLRWVEVTQTGLSFENPSARRPIEVSIERSAPDPDAWFQSRTRSEEPARVERTTLADGTEFWYSDARRMGRVRSFMAFARRGGTMFSLHQTLNEGESEVDALRTAQSLAVSLSYEGAGPSLTDPAYGDKVDFPDDMVIGWPTLTREGPFEGGFGLHERLYVGRLLAWAPNLEGAMTLVEATISSSGGRPGPRRRESGDGWHALWSSSPKGTYSYYGAVSRGGRRYYLRMNRPRSGEPSPRAEEFFLRTLRSIRP